jgi:hypothetical protein
MVVGKIRQDLMPWADQSELIHGCKITGCYAPGVRREAEIDFVADDFGLTLRLYQRTLHMDDDFMAFPDDEMRA